MSSGWDESSEGAKPKHLGWKELYLKEVNESLAEITKALEMLEK